MKTDTWNKDRSWNNYGGYGVLCGRGCAEAKAAAGILPKGALESQQAETDRLLAEAAVRAAGQQTGWSATQTAAVAGVSLLAIGLMVVIIKKVSSKKSA